MDETKSTGKVKWFNSALGYGFILRQDGSELFLHYTNAIKENNEYIYFKKGDIVEFIDGINDDGRPAAKQVQKIIA